MVLSKPVNLTLPPKSQFGVQHKLLALFEDNGQMTMVN